MSFLTLVVSWAVLAVVVIVMAIYRRSLSNQTDELVHVSEAEIGAVERQRVIGKKLEVIDNWGKILTVVVLVYGIALAGYYLYLGWSQQSKTAIFG